MLELLRIASQELNIRQNQLCRGVFIEGYFALITAGIHCIQFFQFFQRSLQNEAGVVGEKTLVSIQAEVIPGYTCGHIPSLHPRNEGQGGYGIHCFFVQALLVVFLIVKAIPCAARIRYIREKKEVVTGIHRLRDLRFFNGKDAFMLFLRLPIIPLRCTESQSPVQQKQKCDRKEQNE